MVAVNLREGVRYGAYLLGYFIVLFLIGGIIIEIGVELFLTDSLFLTIIGAIVGAIGGLVIYAGLLGFGYKIIADAVEQGIRSSQRPAEEATGPSRSQQIVDVITNNPDDQDVPPEQ
ncbi:hypothetical protein [Halococcus thailandensis]|uniref:Uncharacterized protein n=1 Tax=Halococcus thailandensis JCM 13552 TaxID=1227457 RepID=M0N6F1_9EURY|nr:hypothetical protein [Halococcus thailandensis]EMA52275.1 hypothetical protein C451_12035 [Halococcus thailandensis JCM 13552]